MRLVLIATILVIAGTSFAATTVDRYVGPSYTCTDDPSFSETSTTGGGRSSQGGSSASSVSCTGLLGGTVAVGDAAGNDVAVSGGIRTVDESDDTKEWSHDASTARCRTPTTTDACDGSRSQAHEQSHWYEERIGLWITDDNSQEAYLLSDCTSSSTSQYSFEESWDHTTGAHNAAWSKTSSQTGHCATGVMTPQASIVLLECSRQATLTEQDGTAGYARQESSSENCRIGPQTDATVSVAGSNPYGIEHHTGVDLVTDADCHGFVACQHTERAVAPAAETTVLVGGTDLDVSGRQEVIRVTNLAERVQILDL